ncbi:MAG: hypothetical protein AMJ95_08495 [Omnitrophica WOR_2 bacterium SM23_72]|nr:MAG: hypothetical protein AMJ95_08495 [Omnitrophica WOR_2 bacterium SM23_72]
MISYFDKIKSLRNLRCGHASGQVATLLILIITAVLIFVLTVANVGQVSNYATDLSNAADAASMLLASIVGTKSYQLSGALMMSCEHPFVCCVPTGFLSVILAIIFAIVLIVVAWYLFPLGYSTFLGWAASSPALCIGAGALGGALGGAIGGAIAGTGWLQGAIQGAIIGASIGYGLSMGAQLGGKLFAETKLAPWASALHAGIPTLPPYVMPVLVAPSVAGAIVGAALGVALSAASSIYNVYVGQQMWRDAMEEALNAINGLPDEITRRRETVFFNAFINVIDDPNKVVDVNDSDNDGDSEEMVPNFQSCWDRRTKWIKEANQAVTTEQTNLVRQFLSGPLHTFVDAVVVFLHAIYHEQQWHCSCDAYGNCDGYGNPNIHVCCTRDDYTSPRGGLIKLFEALESAGYPISFWEPGPTQAQLDAWHNWDPFGCSNCPPPTGPCGTVYNPVNQCTACEPPDPPSGFDEVDFVAQDLYDFKEIAAYLLGFLNDGKVGELAYHWRVWVPWFYNPDPVELPDDYYHTLYLMVNGDSSSTPRRVGLRNWLREIERIRRRLPICNYGTGGWYFDGYGNLSFICVTPVYPDPLCYNCILATIDPVTGRPNPPCRWHPNDSNFASVDTDIDDEFAMARKAINDFIDAVEPFRQACKSLYEALVALGPVADPPDTPMACGLGGGNPALYTWTDSRGTHTIMIRIGRYAEPMILKRKTGNWLKGKECIELYNHTQNVSVEIIRRDPNPDVGILGQWNPVSQGQISRKSVAQYRGLKSFDDRCYPFGWVRIVDR